ncbi:DgyrCDS5715 [Dimorphilus gyrociliatus]|nr:DgyrCDS5715 [Dimorphilus gyrociliatus]
METNIDSCKKRPLSITSTTSSTTSSLPRHQKKKLAPFDLSMTSYIQNISSEIVRTEETFANDLKQIIDAYLIPLRSTCDLSNELTDSMFCNIEELYDFSQSLLAEMKDVISEPAELADIFVRRCQEFDDIYFPYCSNFQRASAAWNRCLCNPTHNRTLMSLKVQHGHTFNLHDYLLKPVQRILKYPLLLSNMSQKADEDLKPRIMAAHLAMQNVAAKLNNFNSQLNLYSQIPEAYKYGKIINFGLLRVLDVKGQRSVYLFEKALLVAKKKDDEFLNDKLIIEFRNLTMCEVVPEGNLFFRVFHFQKPEVSITFKASSKCEKKKWCDQIKERMMVTFEKKLPDHVLSLVMNMGPIEKENRSSTANSSSSKRLTLRRMSTTLLPDGLFRNFRSPTTGSLKRDVNVDITSPMPQGRAFLKSHWSESGLITLQKKPGLRRSKSFESIENLCNFSRPDRATGEGEKKTIEDTVTLFADDCLTDEEQANDTDQTDNTNTHLAVSEDLDEEESRSDEEVKKNEDQLRRKSWTCKDSSKECNGKAERRRSTIADSNSSLSKKEESGKPNRKNRLFKKVTSRPAVMGESRVGERMAVNDPPSYGPYTLERRRKDKVPDSECSSSQPLKIDKPSSQSIEKNKEKAYEIPFVETSHLQLEEKSKVPQDTEETSGQSLFSNETPDKGENSCSSTFDIYEKCLVAALESSDSGYNIHEDNEETDTVQKTRSQNPSRVKRALSVFETRPSRNGIPLCQGWAGSSDDSAISVKSLTDRKKEFELATFPFDGKRENNFVEETRKGWVRHVVDRIELLECGEVTNSDSEV